MAIDNLNEMKRNANKLQKCLFQSNHITKLDLVTLVASET